MGVVGQHAKKVVSDSPGLVDFAIGLVNFVLNLADGQVKFFEGFKLQKNCEINSAVKMFLGLVEMTFGLCICLGYSSFILPEWQALKILLSLHPVGSLSKGWVIHLRPPYIPAGTHLAGVS